MVIVYDYDTGEQDKYMCSVEDALITSALMKRRMSMQISNSRWRNAIRDQIKPARLEMARAFNMMHLDRYHLSAWESQKEEVEEENEYEIL